jgi:hypothetical protein
VARTIRFVSFPLGEGVEQVTYHSNASTTAQPNQFLSVKVSAP